MSNEIPLNAPVQDGPSVVSGPLAANVAPDAQPTRLVDLFPGSTVRITTVQTGRSRTGRVLERYVEYGATAEPAVVFLPDGAESPELLTDDRRWKILVLRAAEQFLGAPPPPGAELVRVKPTRGAALRFAGGVGSAMSLVQWSLGALALQYVEATEDAADYIRVHGIEEQVIVAGDYLVKHEDDTWHIVPAAAYPVRYEVTR